MLAFQARDNKKTTAGSNTGTNDAGSNITKQKQQEVDRVKTEFVDLLKTLRAKKNVLKRDLISTEKMIKQTEKMIKQY